MSDDLRTKLARALHDDAAAINHWCPEAMDYSFAASRPEWLSIADACLRVLAAEPVSDAIRDIAYHASDSAAWEDESTGIKDIDMKAAIRAAWRAMLGVK